MKGFDGLGDLFRFHERVRPVEQQQVQMVGMEALEDSVRCLQDIFLREIEITAPDRAFALQQDFVPDGFIHADGFGEQLFAAPAAVDIGVVKEVDAPVHGGADLLPYGHGGAHQPDEAQAIEALCMALKTYILGVIALDGKPLGQVEDLTHSSHELVIL